MLRLSRRLALLLALSPAALPAQAPRTTHVILVTFDGVRPQEFFGGLDTNITHADKALSGIDDSTNLTARYGRLTREARRHAVMPFFWDSLAPRALVLGDTAVGSRVTITNPHGFSAPGYLEMLTGQAQPDVTSNDPVRYAHRTVLEIVREQLRLPQSGVALFGSWENFRTYAASREDAVLVNAGFDTLPTRVATPRLRELERLERRAPPLWEGARLDVFTGAMAIEYLKVHRPRLLFVSFDDTDDLAHSRRYDRLLDALHGLDDFLRELWQTVQSTPGYRNQTTIILTTDHGRGPSPQDWSDHGD
ncbi:MAG: alkaline phosphatase family protein, partial [Gemmatimonadota bacterium]|nr:alkaline phosphatase family protein [Gemmatimonadota bacterium]